MIPCYQLPLPMQAVLGGVVILLSILALYGLVCACVLRMRKTEIVLFLLTALGALLLQQGLEDAQLLRPSTASHVLLAPWIGTLPAAVIVLLLLLLALMEAALLWRLRRWRYEQLTLFSIKECVDALPDGVCFFTEQGLPLLTNLQMSRLCAQLTGGGLVDTNAFLAALRSGEYPGQARLLRAGPNLAVELADGAVWEFRLSRHLVREVPVEQLLAFRMTEQYRLTRELTDRNRRLTAVGERLRQYGLELQSVIRNDEILTAKIQVHSDVGRVLLLLRTFLAQRAEQRDLSALLARWTFVVNVLSGETRTRQADTLEQFLSDAAGYGLTVAIDGTPPEGAAEHALFLRTARECLSNVKRHAPGARTLSILLREAEGRHVMTFTNDGAPPNAPVVEGGGLKNLRQMAENAGWTMTLESTPRFVLRLETAKEAD